MLQLLGQTDVSNADAGVATGMVFLWVAVAWIVTGFAFYGIFKKAGQPGWAGFVPIYNYYVLLQVVGRPGWWLLLYFIPIVNVVILIIVLFDLSKSFGKGVGFTIGLIFLSIIFLYILGFGSSRYLGPAASAQPQAPPPPPPPAG